MNHHFDFETQHNTQSVVVEKAVEIGAFELILYNDDVNTFEHVIECLIKYCHHDMQQAEQCAWLVHTKGKCTVKSGNYSSLEPLCTALCDNGLSAQIELI